MKKILGITGSRRILGNCEIMAKEISANIRVPHELQLVCLPEFEVLPCKACYACLFKEQRCVQKDDFNQILDLMTGADALIVAVPTYFLGASSSLKRLLDRGLAFYGGLEDLWGKPAVGVGIAGIEGMEGYTSLNVESFLKLAFFDLKGCEIVYGALPGEIFLNEENRLLAVKLAEALFGEALTKSVPSCPLCNGDTFRFIGDNRVRCMLCSNEGTMDVSSGNPVFDVVSGEHHLFLTKEGALSHLEWLRGMKQRYMDERASLKKITQPYRGRDNRVKPEAAVKG